MVVVGGGDARIVSVWRDGLGMVPLAPPARQNEGVIASPECYGPTGPTGPTV